MKKNVAIEMSEAAQEAIDRYDLGTAELRFDPDEDMPRKDTVYKDGVCCMLAIHKATKLCVLEIYIPNSDDGVQMLECYGNDAVWIKPDDAEEFILMADYLESLDLLFVSPDAHSKGIGYSAWMKVEKLYPDTII